MTDRFVVGSATHVGRVRDHNEDNYICRSEIGLWVVADGMGGHEYGEVASAITVEQIVTATQNGRSLEESLQEAHDAVLKAGQTGHGKPGMGSTVVALKVDQNRYEVAWVGDSRVYRANQREFEKLTHDHSHVQELLDNNLIDEQDARVHPMRHIVSQAIGSSANDKISVDTVTGAFQPGDKFLLCSDGLTDEVPDQEICQILRKNVDLQSIADLLVGAALDNGGADNVTVLLVGSITIVDSV